MKVINATFGTAPVVKKISMFGMMLLAGFSFLLLPGPSAGKDGTPPGSPPGSIEVKIDNFSFGPMSLAVAAGSTVTWTNNDDVPHTVVSDDKTTFKSRALDTGEKFSYTFDKPGKYTYFCSVHPRMTAEVVVR